MFRRKPAIEIKTPAQLASMRRAGKIVAIALAEVAEAVRPGVTTLELNGVAAECIARNNAVPSFLGYHGFPAVICASVNDEVVHGIPGDRVLVDGDIISVDCGAILDGWHGDSAITLPVGDISADAADLSAVTEAGMWAGLRAARAGAHLSDIGHAIETSIRSVSDYGIVTDYVGHGIGSSMHMPPSVPNYGSPGRGPVLVPGIALAIEPMVTQDGSEVQVTDDDWTVITADGGLAAHWEHTVAVTDDGPWVLTALDDVRL